jgi:hypothetical protein
VDGHPANGPPKHEEDTDMETGWAKAFGGAAIAAFLAVGCSGGMSGSGHGHMAIGHGAGTERVMGLAWRDAGLPRVERRPPLGTEPGKVLDVHAGAARLHGAADGPGGPCVPARNPENGAG